MSGRNYRDTADAANGRHAALLVARSANRAAIAALEIGRVGLALELLRAQRRGLDDELGAPLPDVEERVLEVIR